MILVIEVIEVSDSRAALLHHYHHYPVINIYVSRRTDHLRVPEIASFIT